MRLRALLTVLLVGIFAPSCVEHLVTIRVYPDGRYLMNFVSRGDSTDVFNEDFPHPFGPTIAFKSLGLVIEVGSTKDLNPANFTDLSFI